MAITISKGDSSPSTGGHAEQIHSNGVLLEQPLSLKIPHKHILLVVQIYSSEWLPCLQFHMTENAAAPLQACKHNQPAMCLNQL